MTFGLGLRHNGKKTNQISLDPIFSIQQISSNRGKFRFVSEYDILPCNPENMNLEFPLEPNDLESVWLLGYILILKEKAITFRNTTGFRIPSTRCENIEL